MSIYQFLIAVRQQDGQQLMNEAGETTSHLMGLFYRCEQFHSSQRAFADAGTRRTIRMVENDLKPCYVFDGKPPQLKSNVVSMQFPVFREPSLRDDRSCAAQEAFFEPSGGEGGRGGGKGDR